MSNKFWEIRRSRIIVAAVGATLAATGWAQTSGGTAATQTGTGTSTTQAAMDTAASSPSGQHDARYVQSISGRFGTFAGSDENLQSLATGLRHGTEITLVGSGDESLSFTPPTRPMGYGNVTHALNLASRQLAAAGITDPTAEEIHAAMLGGTVSTPGGPVTLQGVLQLRSEGMGWGQIAHTLGLRPGRQVSNSAATSAPATAAAARAAGPANRGGGQGGIVTAGGNAFGHGTKIGTGVTTGLGASTAGSGSASAHGRGNAFGRGGK